MTETDAPAIRHHLDALLNSEQLGRSETSRRLLTYLVNRALQNDTPKELEIALDVFGKDATFTGAEDSVVRVAVRTLRQKLAEYYATSAHADGIHFTIPKGSYRLATIASPQTHVAAPELLPATSDKTPAKRWPLLRPVAAILGVLLLISVLANVWLYRRSPSPTADLASSRVQASPIWSDILASHRPLTIVLGNLFMFSQLDPKTGHTVAIRDSSINSSEDLRAFLATNPSFAGDRGQRYLSVIQKAAAISLSGILRIVDRPDRSIEITVGDELQPEQVRNNDIIYIGPITGLGPLSGYYEPRSRYRVNSSDSTVTNTETHRVFAPKGALASERIDYALIAKFVGPTGNRILILTAGMRNAGVLQVARTVTSDEGLSRLEAQLRAQKDSRPDSFEALLTVTGYRQTDLSAEVVDINPLPEGVRIEALNQAK